MPQKTEQHAHPFNPQLNAIEASLIEIFSTADKAENQLSIETALGKILVNAQRALTIQATSNAEKETPK